MSDEQSTVAKLWRLAELERGVERADIDREPRYGSEEVIDSMTVVHKGEPRHLSGKRELSIPVTITVGDMKYER